MRKFIINGMNIGYTAPDRGIDVSYDNTLSGLTATNTQDAIDELVDNKVDKEEGKELFSGCSKLTSFPFAEGLVTISESAFKGCSNLTSVTIPNSVKSIGEGAFVGCSSLTSITFPNSVTSIRRSAFADCI